MRKYIAGFIGVVVFIAILLIIKNQDQDSLNGFLNSLLNWDGLIDSFN